ncbi:MAG: GNAT family N-acetyltransferase [Oscillospiraceae bacterium]|nr:GNAT family N-acetyltransferase [Oscillospiraceae bacterium]
MFIRKMYPTEGKKLAELLFTSVHTLCTSDYTPEELEAWVPKRMDMTKFNLSLLKSYNLVMVERDKIIGFVCIEPDGYVNRLFTHPDHVHRGVATALMDRAEEWAKKKRGLGRVRLAASKTGKGFYLKRGYRVADTELVVRRGVTFENQIMEKYL